MKLDKIINEEISNIINEDIRYSDSGNELYGIVKQIYNSALRAEDLVNKTNIEDSVKKMIGIYTEEVMQGCIELKKKINMLNK